MDFYDHQTNAITPNDKNLTREGMKYLFFFVRRSRSLNNIM